MANKKCFWEIVALVLVFGISLAGYVSTPKEWTVTLAPKLDESLCKHMGPSLQT